MAYQKQLDRKNRETKLPLVQYPNLSVLEDLGVEVLPPDVWGKLGYKANIFNDLSSTDLSWYRSLPPKLQALVVAAPIRGNTSAHDFGKLANKKADRSKFGEVAILNSDCKKLGYSPAGDNWLLLLKDPLPGSLSLSRDGAEKLLPAGCEWINPAQAYIVAVMKKLQSRNCFSYFRQGLIRTSYPHLAIDGFNSSGVNVLKIEPQTPRKWLGFGIARNRHTTLTLAEPRLILASESFSPSASSFG